jgi:hypothetical protein
MRLAVRGGRGLRVAGGSALETVVVDGEVTGDMDGEKRQRRMLGVRVVALFRATVSVSAFVERVGVVQHQGTTLHSRAAHSVSRWSRRKNSSVAWTTCTVGKGTDISIVVELDRKARAPRLR